MLHHQPRREFQASALNYQAVDDPGGREQFRKKARSLFTDSTERPSGDFHVLVVHHRADTLKIMAAMFRKFGYHVTTADDSAKALLYFGRKPCDLLFTDLDMPVLDGYRLSCLLKKHRPQTKAVVTTCCCQAELVDLMRDSTIDAWLFKPFKIDEFRDTLADIGL